MESTLSSGLCDVRGETHTFGVGSVLGVENSVFLLKCRASS